ncbi:MAG: dynamin family protein [Albidovulum sp.]|nr:dynamin family protein [Albidovulum sp.]
MQNAKQTFLTALRTYADVASSTDLDENLLLQGAEIADRIRDFRVLVPVVGSFNVGKTTLINTYLNLSNGRGLPTDIVPQTALATEIHRAQDNQADGVQIFDKDDQLIAEMDIDAFRRIGRDELSEMPENARFARARLKTNVLDFNTQIILVDMPGLDSGVQTHNAAIQRYLPHCSYFFLVVDIERGALRESEILQLQEFLEQEVECTVLANKADRKRKDHDTVTAYVGEQVRVAFGKQIQVHAVSARKGEITAFSKAFESINPDLALRNYWRRQLLNIFDQAVISLHTRYSALNVSSTEAESIISRLKQEQEELEEKLADDERKIRTKYSDRATNIIVREVRNEICGHADELANSFESGGSIEFEQHLNQLVRSKLNHSLHKAILETRQDIETRYKVNVDDLYSQIRRVVESDTAKRDATREDVDNAIREAGEKTSRALDNAVKNLSDGTRSKGFSTMVDALVISTSVVFPWLNVIYVLGSWILDQFGEDERKRKQQQALRSQIVNVLAPKVATDLRRMVTEDYAKVVEEHLSCLRADMNARINRVKADIEKGQAEIEAGKREVDARRESLERAVCTLSEARERIRDA